jgi:hypothetical protein
MVEITKLEQEDQGDKVTPLFPTPRARSVPPLSDEEILTLRQFIDDFAIIRATCPLALRALSKR